MKQGVSSSELRRRAIEVLRESTQLFERAYYLLEAEKPEDVQKVCEVARAKRFHSALLMRKARKLEKTDERDHESGGVTSSSDH